MEKINQDIVDIIYETYILKLQELGLAYYHQFKDVDWSSEELRKNAYLKMESFKNILSDCVDNTKSKIAKKGIDFDKFKDKESDNDRSIQVPVTPKRRSPQTDVRE